MTILTKLLIILSTCPSNCLIEVSCFILPLFQFSVTLLGVENLESKVSMNQSCVCLQPLDSSQGLPEMCCPTPPVFNINLSLSPWELKQKFCSAFIVLVLRCLTFNMLLHRGHSNYYGIYQFFSVKLQKGPIKPKKIACSTYSNIISIKERLINL